VQKHAVQTVNALHATVDSPCSKVATVNSVSMVAVNAVATLLQECKGRMFIRNIQKSKISAYHAHKFVLHANL